MPNLLTIASWELSVDAASPSSLVILAKNERRFPRPLLIERLELKQPPLTPRDPEFLDVLSTAETRVVSSLEAQAGEVVALVLQLPLPLATLAGQARIFIRLHSLGSEGSHEGYLELPAPLPSTSLI